MNIYAVGTIFVQLTLGMNAFITGAGLRQDGDAVRRHRRGLPTLFSTRSLSSRLNMGVQGAALATDSVPGRLLRMGAMVFLYEISTTLHPENKAGDLRPERRFSALPGAGAAPPFIMQASESVISVCFNCVAAALRRRPCRRRHDDPDQRHAVRHAAAAGAGRRARSRSSAITTARKMPTA